MADHTDHHFGTSGKFPEEPHRELDADPVPQPAKKAEGRAPTEWPASQDIDPRVRAGQGRLGKERR